MTSAFPSLNTPILASSLPLHADTVHYLVYEGDHTVVCDIRRKIVEEEEDVNPTEILKSTLWTVQVVSQNIHRLWLFYIGNHNSKPLQDQRLVKVFESTMILRCLYPCSEECSFQNAPCPNCDSPEFPSVYTAAKCLPRRPWRRPWNAFRDAVRAALIRSVNHNNTDQDQNPKRWASALKNGFIVADAILQPNSDEWVTSGWEQTRSLLYVHIQIVPALESSPRLIVHPAVLRTPYCILGKTPTAGTALTLLPYGTPAYFMANYSGPTSTLTTQFRDVLRGLAVDGWEGPNYPKKNGKGRGRGEARNPVNYVIVFIPVNIDGSAERKGLTVIYPSLLALAIPPSVRAPMDISLLPTLPAPLQPSPMVPAAVVSVTASAPVNGALNSPLTGPRSAYQFPSGPSIPSATPNAFPTLNSPLVFGSGVNHNQLPQAHTSPLYSQGAGNVVHVGAAGPGTPFPLSTITSSTLASSLIAGNPSQLSTSSEARRNPSLSINSNDMLLRAHRVVSTASRLSALASPSSVNTPVAIPTPGVPTPGTVSVTTPGGPSTAREYQLPHISSLF
ncbi:hypothetical protein DFJ43DRAFT_23051 [Lentinula guzmanii]|uniref:Mediator complex subunit Med13 N-terminal domain-containing protein n=1 Tax=Lentinula guzmanii TaxID=2804957 RepID=A0AA38N609_9AGAR|nr:hypothetical protein DFJ43DRAFT_23051 [Lentinula guzmanii]